MKRFLSFSLFFLFANAAFSASFDPPKRKSGLWELKLSSPKSQGPHAIQQCIDEKTDDLMKKQMMENRQNQCSKNEMHKEGDNIIAEVVCKVQNSTATTRAVFTGQFDSAYKADIKTTYQPPLGDLKEASSTIEAKWLGPCQAGQKPGDIVVPGMPKFNMDEMRKGMMKGQ
jgi:hypothetical protein